MSSGALHHDGIRSERPLFCARLTASLSFCPTAFFLFESVLVVHPEGFITMEDVNFGPFSQKCDQLCNTVKVTI